MAGELKITAQCQITGPLGDGRAAKVPAKWQEAVTRTLGELAVELLAAFPMNKTGRARGGFQANLHTVRKSVSQVNVPGPMISGVTWAPWLEGSSKRNSSTRFRGYRLFRRTRAEIDRRATQAGQDELDKLMPELGGE